jgi:hypothetical protein
VKKDKSLEKKDMETINKDTLEKFILRNKDEFEYAPPENHMEKFLSRLNARIRHYISIVPYLLRVAIATIIIFIASVAIWNNFIRSDRNAISLRDKISLEIYRLLD